MSTSTRKWRSQARTWFAGLTMLAGGMAINAQAAITEVQPGDLAGAATVPYTGPADPILHFTGDDGNPTNADVATALGYTGPLFCSRLNSPPGPSGTVMVGSVTINYWYDPTGQNVYFSWDANAPVIWVTAKGGPSAYVFTYLPGGVFADNLLRSPAAGGGNPAGLSHFDFCLPTDEPAVFPAHISKTANASWTRYHDWTLDKNATPDAIEMYNGDTHDVDYVVTATKDPWGNFTVEGVIELSDPNGQGYTAANVGSVTDTIVFDDDAANTAFNPALNCAGVDDATDVFYRCTYTITLSSKTYSFLAAGGSGVNTATAQVSWEGNNIPTDPESATANFTFPAEPAMSFGDELVLDDTMIPGAPDHTFTDDGSFPYTHTFACGEDEGDNPNTATGTFSTGPDTNGEVMANETVNVDCHDVLVEKTALTRFDRDFDWTPDKKIVVRPEDLTVEDKTVHCSLLDSGPYTGNYLCDDITIKLPLGGVYDTVYSLTATKDAGSDSGFQVYGVITVSWPADAPEPVFTGDPTDVLKYAAGLPASIDATVSNCVVGVNQITCDYVADAVDDRSGTNEASIERPYVCYASDGSIKACAVPGSSTYTGTAGFSFGDPANVADDCVDLSDLFNGTPGLNLGPMPPEWLVASPVCATSTFYVTGEPTPGTSLNIFADWAPPGFEEFTPECTFYVPNVLKLALDDGMVRSDEAVIAVNVPDACNQGCTLTQGYWKTHANYAPKPQFSKKRDANWDMVGAQAEDTMFFLSGQSWINVFWTPPKGNSYYNLAHQYMAAKLNVYNGASTPAAVAAAITQAEAWFSTYPPNHGFWKTNKSQVMQTAGLLGSYNEGSVGPGHCSEAPVAAIALTAIK